MTSTDRDPGVLPYVVASVTCDACCSGFVTTRLPGQPSPTTALAGESAGRAGWHQAPEYATGWRCGGCRKRYGDAGRPRRFTLREALARGQDPAAP